MQSKRGALGVVSRAAASAGLLALPGVAHAQWTVSYLHPTELHPANAWQSYATGGAGATQVGYTLKDGIRRACRWSGSAASWVELHPAGSVGSAAFAISDNQQVGGYAFGTAAVWSGSSVSTLGGAAVFGMSGTHQVGYRVVSSAGYIFHALLWNGTSASVVNLNPPSATSSFAWGISGTQQVGQSRVWEQGEHAGLWNGSAASWVDLNPAGAWGSCALATSGTQQAGYAYLGASFARHAGLWSGSSASWVELHPVGATSSEALSISGPYQVGYANFGLSAGSQTASLWSGTAASWEDLSLSLSGSWSNTIATCVWSDGSTLYVVGHGHRDSANRDEALLWSRPLSAPCYANCDSSSTAPVLNVGDFSCFLSRFASGDPYANCDQSTAAPVLNVADFGCFLQRFALGCP